LKVWILFQKFSKVSGSYEFLRSVYQDPSSNVASSLNEGSQKSQRSVSPLAKGLDFPVQESEQFDDPGDDLGDDVVFYDMEEPAPSFGTGNEDAVSEISIQSVAYSPSEINLKLRSLQEDFKQVRALAISRRGDVQSLIDRVTSLETNLGQLSIALNSHINTHSRENGKGFPPQDPRALQSFPFGSSSSMSRETSEKFDQIMKQMSFARQRQLHAEDSFNARVLELESSLNFHKYLLAVALGLAFVPIISKAWEFSKQYFPIN